MNFELSDFSIPLKSGLEFSQTYELIGGTVTQRMQSGKAIKQTHFNKIRTVISGQGWMPPGLDSLDYSLPLVLKCVTPRVISSLSNQLTLPSGRRTDVGFEPKGYALKSGELLEVNLIINADMAILENISAASSYQVHYYPQILVFADPPQIQGNLSNAEFSWSITCEEV